MTNQQVVVRKKTPHKDPSPEEERDLKQDAQVETETPEAAMLHDPYGLAMLQDQAGNLATQQFINQGNGGAIAEGGPSALAHIQRRLDEDAEEIASVEEEQETTAPALEQEEQMQIDEATTTEEMLDSEEPLTEEMLTAILSNQAQAEAQANLDDKEPLEVGDIKIEKPTIEYYDVKANTLEEALAEVKEPEEWYDFEYEYDADVENEVVIEANITVKITIHAPRWTGPGWEDAAPAEQARWTEVMTALQLYDKELDETTELPPGVLLGPAWKDAPDALKNQWRLVIEDFQKEEQSLLELIYRRAIVFQQRLINQPDKETEVVFNKFIEDIEKEEEEYNRERDAEEELDILLSGSKLVQ